MAGRDGRNGLGLIAIWMLAISAAAAEPQRAAEGLPRRIDFRRDVAIILQQQCTDCHGGVLSLAGLRLDRRESAFEGGDSGSPIKPGNSKESLLVERLVDKELGIIMPPSFPFFPGEKAGLADEQIETLKLWIDQGAEWPEGVSLASETEATAEHKKCLALFAAIRGGDAQVAAGLLSDASLVNATDSRGTTPLMHAALVADTSMMRLLIERGALVNAANSEGVTPLMWAAGDADKARLLVDHGAKADARSNVGRTPLLFAATYAGNAEVARLLIEHGASARDVDDFRETALTSASKRGDVELVRVLIAAGADVHAGGLATLVWATEEGNLETVACLLEHGAGENRQHLNEALVSAAVRGPSAVVRLLLEHGADPNGKSASMGLNALQGAAYSASTGADAVAMLLDRGADVLAKTASGETALDLARKAGNAGAIELLEKQGAMP